MAPDQVPSRDDYSIDRLLDLLHVALEDERVRIPAPALVRVRRRFAELAELEGSHIERRPVSVERSMDAMGWCRSPELSSQPKPAERNPHDQR